jgi:actin related protein 2/3 complex subunit 3
MALLPLKTTFKGPAPSGEKGVDFFSYSDPNSSSDKEDIIDEALNYFKANVLFRNYEPKGTADRVLIYLTLYITSCLQKISGNKANSEKALYQLSIENFVLPGDKGFVLGGFVSNPQNRAETGNPNTFSV